MSIRDHRKGLVRTKSRQKLPDYVRKAGPHQPREERRSGRREAIRKALQEG